VVLRDYVSVVYCCARVDWILTALTNWKATVSPTAAVIVFGVNTNCPLVPTVTCIVAAETTMLWARAAKTMLLNNILKCDELKWKED